MRDFDNRHNMKIQYITISDNLDEMLVRYKREEDCVLIVYCLNGMLQIQMNEQTYNMSAQDILLCRPKQYIGAYMRSPDMKCRVIAVRRHAMEDIMYLCVREEQDWWDKAQYVQSHPVVHLNERQQEATQLFERLFVLYAKDDSVLNEKIRRIFVQAAIYELLDWVENRKKDEQPNTDSQGQTSRKKDGRQSILFREFVRVATEKAGCEREVSWYAGQLAVTPKYLSATCRTISGKSASVIIHDICIKEIKRLLRQSDLSAKEIASRMNFASLSFFCKYVKQHLGMSAGEYRACIAPMQAIPANAE